MLWKNRMIAEAEQGDPNAQYALGAMYADNAFNGRTEDLGEAVKWFLKAADHDHLDAQFAMSLYFFKGYGVQKNLVLAHMWASIAASYNRGADISAKDRVREMAAQFKDKVASDMTPEEIAKSEQLAQEWIRKRLPLK